MAPANEPITDATIGKAGAALHDVAQLQQKYQGKMEAASPEQKQGMSEQANAEAVQAIQSHGLSVQEYSNVIRTAQNEPGGQAEAAGGGQPGREVERAGRDGYGPARHAKGGMGRGTARRMQRRASADQRRPSKARQVVFVQRLYKLELRKQRLSLVCWKSGGL